MTTARFDWFLMLEGTSYHFIYYTLNGWGGGKQPY